jgi:nucleotide-binding universal stress UspA family protein
MQRKEGKMFEHILVPLDGSSLAECVLPLAVSLARSHGARLVLAHILRRPEMPDPLWASEEELSLLEQLAGCQQRRAERYLEDVSKRLSVDAEVVTAERQGH